MRIALIAVGEVKDSKYADELVHQLRMWFGLSSIEECFWHRPMEIADLQIVVHLHAPTTDENFAMHLIDAEVEDLKEKVRFYIQSRNELDQLTEED